MAVALVLLRFAVLVVADFLYIVVLVAVVVVCIVTIFVVVACVVALVAFSVACWFVAEVVANKLAEATTTRKT